MRRMPLVEAFAQAVAHQQGGRAAEAETVLREILAVAPEHPETLYFLGLVESEQKRFAAAAGHIEQAIAVAPRNTLFHHHIYEIYRRLGRTGDALAAARRAIASFPEETLILANLAAIHRDRLDLDAAIACAEQAVDQRPHLAEAHFALAEALLLRGDFARGFAEYEWRWGIAGAGRLMASDGLALWDGEAMPAGRLLLVADQGFGDIIMFARFLPGVLRRCPSVAMVCPLALHRVIAQIAPEIMVFERWATPPADAYCPLSSLPHVLKVKLAALPGPMPYLRADPSGVVPADDTIAIGIAWAGSDEHQNDHNRSTTLAAFAPLAELADVTLVSLQKGPAQAEIARYAGRARLVDGGALANDFMDTAGIVAALDLVVTVDTSVAHLAGAMGIPVWILLPHVPDWRWMLERGDSPWYPSARLFRLSSAGQWDEAVRQVAEEASSSFLKKRTKKLSND